LTPATGTPIRQGLAPLTHAGASHAAPPGSLLRGGVRPLSLRVCASGGKSTGQGTDSINPYPFDKERKLGGSGGSGGGSGGSGSSGGGGSGGGGGGFRPPAFLLGLWGFYLKALEGRPVLAKGCTAATTNCIGDVIAQQLTKRPEDPYRADRTLKFTALGFIVIGPLLHTWYNLLARTVTWKGPSAVAAKVALDRLFFAPVMIGAVFGATLAMDGKAHLLRRKLEADWWPTVLANWTVWVPAQAVNFALVPTQLQVLWAQTFAMAWKAYLSWKAHKEIADPAAAAPVLAAAAGAVPAKGKAAPASTSGQHVNLPHHAKHAGPSAGKLH
jgi:peroxisomal membrane protein 2